MAYEEIDLRTFMYEAGLETHQEVADAIEASIYTVKSWARDPRSPGFRRPNREFRQRMIDEIKKRKASLRVCPGGATIGIPRGSVSVGLYPD